MNGSPDGRIDAPCDRSTAGRTTTSVARIRPAPSRGGPGVCDARGMEGVLVIGVIGLALALGAALLVVRRRTDEADALQRRLASLTETQATAGARQAAEAAARSTASLEEQLPVGVLHFDADRRIDRANGRAYVLLDVKPGRLIGRTVMEAFLDPRAEGLIDAVPVGRRGGRRGQGRRPRAAHPRRQGPSARPGRPARRARGRHRAPPPPADPVRVHRQPEPRAADPAEQRQPARRDARPRRRDHRRPRTDARADHEDRGRDRPPGPDGHRAARPRPNRGRRPALARGRRGPRVARRELGRAPAPVRRPQPRRARGRRRARPADGPGRRGAPRPGLRQPRPQRDQVQPRRRRGPGRGARGRRRGRGRGRRSRDRHLEDGSTAHLRALLQGRPGADRGVAEPDSACRSHATSSKAMEAASGSSPRRAGARRSRSRSRSDRRPVPSRSARPAARPLLVPPSPDPEEPMDRLLVATLNILNLADRWRRAPAAVAGRHGRAPAGPHRAPGGRLPDAAGPAARCGGRGPLRGGPRLGRAPRVRQQPAGEGAAGGDGRGAARPWHGRARRTACGSSCPAARRSYSRSPTCTTRRTRSRHAATRSERCSRGSTPRRHTTR